MTDFPSLRSRATRAIVASLALAALVSAGSSAWAADAGISTGGTDGATPSESALQVEAQELAGQIEADGRTLDQLSEALDAAQIRSQQLGAQLRVLRAGIARTHARVVTDRAELRQQALLGYVTGGAPITEDIPQAMVDTDPSLAVSYAEIVAGTEHRTVVAYEKALDDENRQSRQLTQALRESSAAVLELRADRNDAAKAFTARQMTLALVKGRLAALVAQVQAAQQRAEQSSIEASLVRQGQAAPPAAPSSSTTPSDVVAPPPTASRATTVLQPPDRATTRSTPTSRAPSRVSSTTTRPPTRIIPPPSTRPPTPPPTPPPTTTPTTAPPPVPPPVNVPANGWRTAVAYAYAQLGKPYQWGGAGPRSFDCSGLTMMAWEAAGVYLPHLAQDQYDLTKRIPLSDALPGDLIFYGTPSDVYHVGIYIGGGEMIDAPETGRDVSITSIYWGDLLGAGRVVG